MNKLKPLYYLKYVDNQYVKSFKDGNLFFNSLNYFENLENNNNDKKIGDQYEGTKLYRSNHPVLKINNIVIPVKDIVGPVDLTQGLSNKEKSSIGIACFMAITRNDLIRSINPKEFVLKEEFISDVKKMGSSDRTLFLVSAKVINYVKRKDELKDGLVKYYDPHDGDSFKLIDNKDEAVFYKRMSYKYQHEYRLVKDLNKHANITKFPNAAKNLVPIDIKNLNTLKILLN